MTSIFLLFKPPKLTKKKKNLSRKRQKTTAAEKTTKEKIEGKQNAKKTKKLAHFKLRRSEVDLIPCSKSIKGAALFKLESLPKIFDRNKHPGLQLVKS